MITAKGLQQLGFTSLVDFELQDDGNGTYIAEWLSDQPQPSVSDIEAAHTVWQTEYDSLAYARSRQAEYPSIEECVHAILDDDLDTLQVKRQAVKAKYPKG
jgi:hypothetical protein